MQMPLVSNDSLKAEEARRAMVEMQFKRIAVSQGEAIPGPERMALLVADAVRLWAEIPTEELNDAVSEGLIQAGNFPLKAGGVAKAWRDRKPSEKRFLGAGRMNEGETVKYLAWLDECGRIAEQERLEMKGKE